MTWRNTVLAMFALSGVAVAIEGNLLLALLCILAGVVWWIILGS